MKKTCCTFLLLLVLFSSCSKVSSPKNSQKPSTENITSVDNNLFIDYSYGAGVKVANGYYFLEYNDDNSFNICYLDYNTRITTILCNRVECLHNNEACLGWRSSTADATILANNDNIFLLFKENSTSSAYYEILNFAGNLEKHISLPRNSYFSPPFVINTSNLICCNEFFDDEKQETLQQLVEIELSSGKLTTLTKAYAGLCHFMVGATNKQILVKNIFVDNENPTDIKNTSQLQTLFGIDMQTKSERLLFEWETKEKKTLVFKNYLFYINVKDGFLTKMSLETLKEEFISIIPFTPNPIGSAFLGGFDDIALFLNVEYENNAPKNKLYAININSGECSQILLYPDEEKTLPIQIVSDWQDYYLVVSSIVLSDKNVEGPDGTIFTVQRPTHTYSLIEKTDYLSNKANYIDFKQ